MVEVPPLETPPCESPAPAPTPPQPRLRPIPRPVVEQEGLTAKTLRDALEVWKDITFNYESTDAPDFVPTATPAM